MRTIDSPSQNDDTKCDVGKNEEKQPDENIEITEDVLRIVLFETLNKIIAFSDEDLNIVFELFKQTLDALTEDEENE